MKLENVYSKTAQKAREQAEEVLTGAQMTVKKASSWVDAGKRPVAKAARASLKFSSISHQTTDKLLKNQAKMLEHELDAVSDYLQGLADAEGVRDIARRQLSVVPQLTRRAVDNTRETVSILREAGSDVRDLISDIVRDIRKQPVAKKAAKTAKTAKKAASKAGKNVRSKAKAVTKKATTVQKKAKAA